MNIVGPAGKYVLAVSGGVDSMVLLDILHKQAGIELVVSHFNHGIRQDGELDEELVSKVCKKYGVVFEIGRGNLGEGASEERAREARYEFLNEIKTKHQADGIITAHHQDDLIETAVINILRGTGPRGLVSIQKNKKITRPLLHISKDELIKYAEKNDIIWREDRTNNDPKYLRNYVRHNLIPKIDGRSREKLLASIDDISKSHEESQRLIQYLGNELKPGDLIDRGKFINLPSEIGSELVIYWLRAEGLKDFNKSTVARLSMALKTAKPGTKYNVSGPLWLVVESKSAKLLSNR